MGSGTKIKYAVVKVHWAAGARPEGGRQTGVRLK
jgi:hypothetical protein